VATGCGGLRLHPAVAEGCRRWRGTGSSNPSPSSGESGANSTQGSARAVGVEDGRAFAARDDHLLGFQRLVLNDGCRTSPRSYRTTASRTAGSGELESGSVESDLIIQALALGNPQS